MGTENFSELCPRRVAMNEPWISSVFRLFRSTGGEPAQIIDKISGQCVDAFGVIKDGQAHREKALFENMRKESAVKKK